MFALPPSQVCDTYVGAIGPLALRDQFHTIIHYLYYMCFILSSPAAVLQFIDSVYSSVEGMRIIRPFVQLLTNIGTDLTVVATPVDYASVNNSQSPVLDVIPVVPSFNFRRPIIATSK